MHRAILLSCLWLLGACGEGGGAAVGGGNNRATVGAYPAVAVLDAFKDVCGTPQSFARLRQGALAAGWRIIDDPATTPLARNIAMGREVTNAILESEGGTVEFVLFARQLSGEVLYLLLTQVTVDGHAAGDCRLYDPGETRAIPTDVATRWIGRAPLASIHGEDGSRDSWSPALDGSVGNFKIMQAPEGSTSAALARFSGLLISTDRAPSRP